VAATSASNASRVLTCQCTVAGYTPSRAAISRMLNAPRPNSSICSSAASAMRCFVSAPPPAGRPAARGLGAFAGFDGFSGGCLGMDGAIVRQANWRYKQI
jgi:hypothetical protein